MKSDTLILKRFRYHGMLHSFLTSVHKIHLKFAKCYETQVFKISLNLNKHVGPLKRAVLDVATATSEE